MRVLSRRRVLSVLSALALSLGLLTVAAGPGVANDTVQLSTSNPGVGALRLTATVPERSPYVDAVVFEVEGHAPVSVLLGTMAVAGEPDFGHTHAYTLPVAPDTAVLDVPGLDPTGTYRATAHFVTQSVGLPEVGDAEVTTTLTRTKTPFLFSAERDGRRVRFQLGVVFYPTSTVLGTIKIVDLTTDTTMVWGLNAWAQVGATYGLRHPTRPSQGVHRYQARFTPAPAYRDVLGKMTVTSAKVRFPG